MGKKHKIYSALLTTSGLSVVGMSYLNNLYNRELNNTQSKKDNKIIYDDQSKDWTLPHTDEDGSMEIQVLNAYISGDYFYMLEPKTKKDNKETSSALISLDVSNLFNNVINNRVKLYYLKNNSPTNNTNKLQLYNSNKINILDTQDSNYTRGFITPSNQDTNISSTASEQNNSNSFNNGSDALELFKDNWIWFTISGGVLVILTLILVILLVIKKNKEREKRRKDATSPIIRGSLPKSISTSRTIPPTTGISRRQPTTDSYHTPTKNR